MLRIEILGLLLLTVMGLIPEPYAHLWGHLPEGARGTAILLVAMFFVGRRL